MNPITIPQQPDREALSRLHREARADGATDLAAACEAALAGDPAARAAIALAIADDDDCDPCPVTLASGARP